MRLKRNRLCQPVGKLGVVLCALPGLFFCTAGNASSDAPALSPSGLVNAASRSGGSVAPGEIVVLFPSNVGPRVMEGAQIDMDGKVPTLLGETRVWFDGIAAPITYSAAGQVGAVVPYAVANHETTKVVVEYQGLRSAPVELPVAGSAPALFTLDSSGQGQAAMLNETGCCNSGRNPAKRGHISALYATGAGQTSPPGIDGSVAAFDRTADYPVPVLPVQVTVGGQAAEIIYAGAAPHAVAGLLQVNFRVPGNAPIGDAVPLVLSVGGFPSRDGVTMAVRSTVERVLIVDTDGVARNSLRKVLSGAGYAVSVARNGGEAMARSEDQPIDLVLCSLSIAESERLEAIGMMLRARPQIKIAAIAGVLDPASRRAADLFGAQLVLTRGMPSKTVLQGVRELLRPRPVPYVADERPPMFPLTPAIPR
jgi:uncharacterized protein (TIGR03437 family)